MIKQACCVNLACVNTAISFYGISFLLMVIVEACAVYWIILRGVRILSRNEIVHSDTLLLIYFHKILTIYRKINLGSCGTNVIQFCTATPCFKTGFTHLSHYLEQKYSSTFREGPAQSCQNALHRNPAKTSILI